MQPAFNVGDRIAQFAGKTNPTLGYLAKQEMLNGNHAMDVVVLRNGQRLNFSVTPQIDPKQGIGIIGWGYGNIEIAKKSKPIHPPRKPASRRATSF